MKLKIALVTLMLPISIAFSQESIIEENIKEIYNKYQSLETILTIYQYENFRINLRKKQIRYPMGRSTFYLNLKEWNGKPLYLLTYKFYLEDVSPFIKGLRGAPQGRANKETKNYSRKYENNSSSVGYWLWHWNIN